MKGDKVVGTVTSGDWGHRTGLNLALAFVDADEAVDGARLEVDLLGDIVTAVIIPSGPYDPDNARVRM